MKKISKLLIMIFAVNLFSLAYPASVNAAEEFQLATLKDFLANESYEEELYQSTSIEDEIIAKIKTAAENKQEILDLSQYSDYYTYKGLSQLYFKMIYKNPKLFYASSNSIYYSSTSLKFVYLEDANLPDMINKFNTEIESVVRKLKLKDNNISDLQKEYAVYEYLQEICSYNYEGADFTGSYGSAINNFGIWHTAYGSLVNKSPVCDGYAKAAKILLNEAGIECGILTSSDHAWNYVNIGGKYYQFDVTFEDTFIDSYTQMNTYKYFNLTDEEMESDTAHDANNKEVYCTSSDFSFLREFYYVIYSDYFPSRAGNKLYFRDVQGLNSIKINGTDRKIMDENIKMSPRAGMKNKIYDFDYDYDNDKYYIYSYNLGENINNDSRINMEVMLSGEMPEDMYKVENNLVYVINGQKYYFDISMKEDVNNDGVYDALDISAIASKYNYLNNNIGIYDNYDINRDGIVDIYDVSKVGKKIA